MASDQDFVGKVYPPFSVTVDEARIKAFALAIGDQNPIYQDAEVAAAAGHRAIPAPLTFPYTVAMDAGQSFNILDDMGIEKIKAVHGEQGFTYHGKVYAGDVITGEQRITEIFEKKGGALKFINANIELRNQNDEPVCELRSVIVVRNG